MDASRGGEIEMDLLIFVLALAALGIAANLLGVSSIEVDPGTERRVGILD